MAIQKITSGIIQDGAIAAADIVSVANTAITGNITSSQIAPDQTLNGNVSVTGTLSTPNTFGFKNRIINGGMVIDQRNAGASVTPTNGQYSVDRWQFQVSQASKLTAQHSSVAPTGFSKSLLVTSTSTYSVVAADYFSVLQSIEGFNTADLAFGTASAATVTLSFWVRSSLTGTFGGTLINSAYSRAYPFTYTISNANTWEQKSVTITGDTTGTWIGATNGAGLQVNFGLGVGANNSGTAGAWTGSGKYSATGAVSVVGTNGATFYITGVQLEKGSTATSFDYRPYGTELVLCQRYYQKSYEASIVPGTVVAADAKSLINAAWGYAGAGNVVGNGNASFQVSMRTAPTATIYDKAGNSGKMSTQNSNGSYTDNVSLNQTIASESNIVVQKYTQSCAGIAYAYVVSAEL